MDVFSQKVEDLLIHKRRVILKRTMAGLRDDGEMTARFPLSPGRHSRFDIAQGVMVA
jgi:hypothetical protein